MAPTPDIPVLQSSAKTIIRKSKKAGTLKTLTPRIIRQEIEKEFSLEAGTLDAKEYKSAIKHAVTAVMAERAPSAQEQDVEGDVKASPKKRKPTGDGETEPLPPKRSKAGPSKEPEKGAKRARVDKEKGKQYDEVPSTKKKEAKFSKSSYVVVTSDDEEDEDRTRAKVTTASTSNSHSPPKRAPVSPKVKAVDSSKSVLSVESGDAPKQISKRSPERLKSSGAKIPEKRLNKAPLDKGKGKQHKEIPSRSRGKETMEVVEPSESELSSDSDDAPKLKSTQSPEQLKKGGAKIPEKLNKAPLDKGKGKEYKEIRYKGKETTKVVLSEFELSAESDDAPKQISKRSPEQLKKGAPNTPEKGLKKAPLDKGKGKQSEDIPSPRSKRKEMMKFKSLTVVVSSDEDQESDHGRVKPTSPSALKSSAKSHSPSKHGSTSTKTSPPAKRINNTAEQSDSELSVLIDEPPKRKRSKKGKESENTHKEVKAKTSRKSSATLSKDDETIKRLKSLVVACGVRKAWSKEFQGLDNPSAQIKRLKEILTSLGMEGRMSMEQAKAIRAKRELAQELEDVVSFEKAVIARERRKMGGTTGSGADRSSASDGEGGEGSGDDEPPAPRKTAARSIMAFLADQSDSE